jgi:uncharacterized membrane protein
MSDRAGVARRVALAAWLLLAVSVAAWPFAGAGIGRLSAAIALLPLVFPLPGLVRGSRQALRAAPMALAPALAITLTEIVANPAARLPAGASLALILSAFAAILAALRAAPSG